VANLLEPGQTWALLGDSITEDPEGYASICERAVRAKFSNPGVRVVNAGVSGNKARDMVARFDRDVLSHHPHLVSISVGVNDVWHGFYDFDTDEPLAQYDPERGETLEEYRRDLKWMLQKLSEGNVRTVLVSPTMIGEDPDNRENELLASYVATMKELAEESGAIYCPMNECLWGALEKGRIINEDLRLTTDGVHMTKIGAHAMAGCLLTALGFTPAEVLSK